MMQRHFEGELKKLKDKLYKMGSLVEAAIRKSGDALQKRDNSIAKTVLEEDQRINILEIEIDEFGHELIALMQPTAVDLRLITMVLKITSDLERIGDQAVNIAEKAIDLNKEPPVKIDIDLQKMIDLSVGMVRDSLAAFSEKDAKRAKQICEQDDELDNGNKEVNAKLQQAMKKGSLQFDQAVNLIMVAHNLERIGDLATNIAEDVIYIAKGIDIRHHITERRNQ